MIFDKSQAKHDRPKTNDSSYRLYTKLNDAEKAKVLLRPEAKNALQSAGKSVDRDEKELGSALAGLRRFLRGID